MAEIEAVIFDVDGLMLDTEAVGLIVWTQACADFGFTMTKELFSRMVGRNTADSNAACLAEFGPDVPIQAIRELKIKHATKYIAENGLRAKTGLFELLAALRAGKTLIGIATSTDRPLALERLSAGGIKSSMYDAITCGNEVPNGKPAPDIFLETAKRLGAEPGRCLVLEDSEAGVLGATAAGMRAIMVPDLNQPSPEIRKIAYRVVHSLIEARQEIEALK